MDEQDVSVVEKPSDNSFDREKGQINFDGESKKVHNVDLERGEYPRELKKNRSNSKRELTKAINRVADVMKVGENSDSVEISVRWMDYTFSEFHKACENYRRSLKDEDDLEECTIYFNEAETRFLSMKERVALWNESCKMQVGQITQGGAKVRP